MNITGPFPCLAYVIRDQFEENIGRVVTVNGPAGSYDDQEPGVWWDCTAPEPLPYSMHGSDACAGYCTELEFEDRALRKIGGNDLLQVSHYRAEV